MDAIRRLAPCISVILFVSSPTAGIHQTFQNLRIDAQVEKGGCDCVNYTCGCCEHVDFPKLKINDTGCLNLTYLPQEIGLALQFSLDGKVVFEETVSAKNPPPLCFGTHIPHVDICIKFYNLSFSWSGSVFSGCAELLVVLYPVKEKLKLGCFKIPPSDTRLLYSHGSYWKESGNKKVKRFETKLWKFPKIANRKNILRTKRSRKTFIWP